MAKIRFKRGPESRVPLLEEGEPLITKDTEKFLIGFPSGNVEIAQQEQLNKSSFIPLRLEGEANYTPALLRELNKLDPVHGGSILIPQGEEYTFDTLTITNKNVRFVGSGTLNGKIIIDVEDNNFANFYAEGITFKGSTPIEVKKGRGIRFVGCTFEDNDKAIFVNPDVDAPFHSISMLYVSLCHFRDVNYALYIAKPAGSVDLLANDFIFSQNIVNRAFITHIYAEEMDGIVITGNTFFFPSYNTFNTTKQYNIYIKNSDWVIIANNELFESGFEAIYLENAKHPMISNNNIAWCGQRQPSSGIYIAGTSLQAFIQVVGNNISKATKHGVELSGVSFGNVKDNIIECSLSANAMYYGTTDLATIPHYGTFINGSDSTASLKITTQNNAVNTAHSNRSSYVELSRVDITDTRTTLDSEGVEQINLVQSGAATITSITNGFNGKEIVLQAFNASTTIQHNSSVLLKGAVNATIPNTGILKLRFYSNKWYEVSRNW